MTSRTIRLDAPKEVHWICRTLREQGHECWAVGGAVRDLLAGQAAGDWDLTTSATPAEMRKLFRRTIPIGVEHGTVGVVARDGHMYEVTTFRRDVETFGRRARVVFSDSLLEDLERRDFTINAVAWDPIAEELRDPHGGVTDFQAGVLRTVGEPAQRFAEDRLRVLRALRFAGRFQLEIDPNTWRALRESSGLLEHVSAERIRDELWKVLGDRAPSGALRLYRSSGLLETLYPELSGVMADEPLSEMILSSVDAMGGTGPAGRTAALFRTAGLDQDEVAFRIDPPQAERAARAAYAIMRRLRASNAESDRVTHLIARHADAPSGGAPEPALREWLMSVGTAYVRDAFRILIALDRVDGKGDRVARLFWRCHALLAAGTPMSVRDLAIGGAELKQLGLRPGPHYAEILDDLLHRVLDDPALNQRETLLQLVRERVGEG